MEKNKIQHMLLVILRNKLSFIIDNENLDKHFFSNDIKMAPRTLGYFLYFIHEEFGITVDSKFILDGSFCSINNITDTIYLILNRESPVKR